jgi:MtN3 and saliva related transmembrane protein
MENNLPDASKMIAIDTRYKMALDGRLPDMRLTTLLGFVAGILTTLSFVPQVLHAWRSKRCDDLSWGMLLTFSAGVLLWLIYGLRLWAMPIIAANAVTLALLLTIIALKSRYAAR